MRRTKSFSLHPANLQLPLFRLSPFAFRLFLPIAILVIALSAAAQQPPPIKLTLWQGFKFSEVAMLKENVAEFSRGYRARTGRPVEITVAQVPFNDMIRKIKSAALARQLPDLAFVDANGMVNLAYGGVAAPLDAIEGFGTTIDDLRASYVPGAYDTNIITFKGERHLYGLPAQTTTLALFWNRKMFAARADALRAAGLDAARPPRDWGEFIRYGEILTQAERGIFAFGMNNSMWFTMPFYNMYGAELVRRSANGMLEATLSSPRGEAALQRKVDLYLKHKIEGGAWREGAMDPDQGFANQKYAMILTGPWMIENFRSSGLDFGVALIPRVPLAEAKQLGLVSADATEDSTETQALTAGNIGGQNVVISSASKHPEVALEFARYFTSETVQRRWAEELGQIPVLLAAQQNLNLTKFPEVPTFIEQVRLAEPVPALPYGGAIETEICNPEMNIVLQGRQSVKQALKNIDAVMTSRILNPVNEAEKKWREKQSTDK